MNAEQKHSNNHTQSSRESPCSPQQISNFSPKLDSVTSYKTVPIHNDLIESNHARFDSDEHFISVATTKSEINVDNRDLDASENIWSPKVLHLSLFH